MKVIADIECDSLQPTRIWVIVCKDIETNKVSIFRNPDEDPEEFLRYVDKVDCWIGHNFLSFDLLWINSLILIPNRHSPIDPQRVIDTLIVSRLLWFDIGRHSLGAWGERLGVPKGDFHDWSHLSDEMVEYCQQDVEVCHQIYLRFLSYIQSPQWASSLRLEHDISIVCQELHEAGFRFDHEAAVNLYSEVKTRLDELTEELQRAFPPRTRLIREITPKETKTGTVSLVDFKWLKKGDEPLDLSPFSPGCPFSLFEYIPFNPGSPKQVVERLNELGWKPWEKTKGHIQAERDEDYERLEHFRTYGWKVSEDNLKTLPQDAPEPARKLVQWLLLESRRSTLEEWFKAYQDSDKAIHGTFHHIGAWTGRMSHSGPNMANIPAVRVNDQGEHLNGLAGGYGIEMRSLWQAPEGEWLIGTDADGIQLRILAHYINDPKFTNALISGNKKEGTDAHSLNKRALGDVCRTRDDAKTFIYAFLLGAGLGKIASILGCTPNEAHIAVDSFIEAWPGLKELKRNQIPRDASRGYFVGFDGRLVLIPGDTQSSKEHYTLAGYLQNGEAVIMKTANLWWRRQLLQNEVLNWQQVNFVHDEWQTRCWGTRESAEEIAKIQQESIRQAGIDLNLNCPLAGTSRIGRTWYDTH